MTITDCETKELDADSTNRRLKTSQDMNDKAEWVTPEIEHLTDIDTRADQGDISVRNGGSSKPG